MPPLPEKKSSVVATTSLAILDRVTAEIVTGEVNTHVLRAGFPALTDRQFGLAFSMARRAAEAQGYFVKATPARPGIYRVCTAEDVADKAMNRSRMAVVRKIRQRGDIIVNAQKHAGLDDESRGRLNAEEIVYSRFVQVAERMLLRSQRKKPEGLD